MSLPAARELRRIFPSAEITFWVKASLVQLVKTSRCADHVMSFNRDSGGPLRRPFNMRPRLAAGRFDTAVLFQNAFESAFTAWIARIPVRIGFPTDLRGPLLTLKVPLSNEIKAKHQVYYYLAISEFLENRFHKHTTPMQGPPDCSIALSKQHLSSARELLSSSGVYTGRPIFSLCPGSVNSDAKRWPAHSFALLADLLTKHLDAQVVFLGATNEKGLVQSIQSMMNSSTSVDLTEKADMVTATAVMNLSTMVISNDTGSAHLAVAAKSKVLTIFGPTIAGATAPFGPDAHVIKGEAPCAPCRHFLCPLPDHPCMRSVTPEAVLVKIQEILERAGTSDSKPNN
jgi:heptosyltransferase-2